MSGINPDLLKGPWEVVENDPDKNPYVDPGIAKYEITGEMVPGNRYCLAVVLTDIDQLDGIDIARRMAAAPELFEALRELLDYGLRMSARHEAPAFEKARAALAKALGDPP